MSKDSTPSAQSPEGETDYERFRRVTQGILDPEIKPNGVADIIPGYKVWSETYERDSSTYCIYGAPKSVTDGLIEVLGDKKDAKILDLGAGTGLIGELLLKEGYKNLDALDPSEDMLDLAREKGIYKRVICDYLGTNRLDIPDATYDGLILAGVFAPNHATDSCFEETIRIMKPGGYFVFIVSESYLDFPEFKGVFEPRIRQLEKAGHWKLVSRVRRPYKYLVDGPVDFPGLMFTLQRL